MRRLLGTLAILWLGGGPAGAATAQESISSCNPNTVQAGETVLLTLTGQFPAGTLTAEFFPQHIRMLNLTRLDQASLALQVEVAHEAPAGKYNILLYNGAGEEALGQDLLEVRRRLHAPRILSAEPLEFDAALDEIELRVRCDVADEQALASLSVDWTANGHPVEVMSSFSRSSVNAFKLVVSGQMPVGQVLGKVYFGVTPIFVIPLTRTTQSFTVFGHRPLSLPPTGADRVPISVSVFGEGLSHAVTQDFLCQLVREDGPPVVGTISVMDKSRAEVLFGSWPQPGEYTLTLQKADVVVYQGPLVIAGSLPSAGASPSQPSIAPALEVSRQAWEAVSVWPLSIDGGQSMVRLQLEGIPAGVSADGLRIVLSLGSTRIEPIFVGLADEVATLVFKAGVEGWTTGVDYHLIIEDSAGERLLSTVLPAR